MSTASVSHVKGSRVKEGIRWPARQFERARMPLRVSPYLHVDPERVYNPLTDRALTPSDPLFVPFLGVLALMLPLPLFLRQSLLQLGDPTAASVLLAIVTALLPLAMLLGLGLQLRRCRAGAIAVLDVLAMLAVLQSTTVLAAWGLVPLRLWT